MKLDLKKFAFGLGLVSLLALQTKAFGFALLGPVQPWMQSTNGVIQPGDIGGPMDIGSGYRWNVPVLTYGFDQSFIDYFGSNGVAAVQSAIQIINDLPPASQMVLTNFPFDSKHLNYAAQVLGLYDLKSQTLPLLLEHLGLTQATRNIFVMKQWASGFSPSLYPSLYGISPNALFTQIYWQDWAVPDFIAMRNFDPQTLDYSQYVNGSLYTAYIMVQNNQNSVVVYAADPFFENSAVADSIAPYVLGYGAFFTGLTYDDVGGLAYLFSTNNVCYETLLPGVCGIGTNLNSFVNGAWRPGVDKITFVTQPVDSESGSFLPLTNCFTDTYITNGNLVHQQLQRVVAQPDFLFSVGDTGKGDVNAPYFTRTGTTNWINNAALNENTNGEGPGVIQPPVQIVFSRFGCQFATFDGDCYENQDANGRQQFWGSFDGSLNAPVVYPIPQSGMKQLTLRMWLELGNYPYSQARSFEWTATGAGGGAFTFQASTNLINWLNLFTVTNNGGICTYLNNNPTSSSLFYRLMPQ